MFFIMLNHGSCMQSPVWKPPHSTVGTPWLPGAVCNLYERNILVTHTCQQHTLGLRCSAGFILVTPCSVRCPSILGVYSKGHSTVWSCSVLVDTFAGWALASRGCFSLPMHMLALASRGCFCNHCP